MVAEEVDGRQPLDNYRTVLDHCRTPGRMLWAMATVQPEGAGARRRP